MVTITPEQQTALNDTLAKVNEGVAAVNAEKGTSISTIPQIKAPTPYVSSTDVATQFENDKKFIDQRTQSTTLAQDMEKAANQGKPGYDILGNPIKSSSTSTTTTPSKTSPVTSSGEQAGNLKTYEDKIADGQAKFDEQLKQDTADAQARLKSTLDTLGTEYQATKTNITNQYADLLKKTERLKALDIGRRQAYGLGAAMYDPIGHTDAVTLATDEWNQNITKLTTEREAALQQAAIAYENGKAGALAASRKEVMDIEDRIRQATTDFQTRLGEQLKTANEAIKLKYQEFDERGKLAAQKALLQFAAYKAATTPEEKDKIIRDAIEAVGGDPTNITEYSAVRDTLEAQKTAEAKAEFDARKQELDLKKLETDISHTQFSERLALQQEDRAQRNAAINQLIERAKLGDQNALEALGVSTNPAGKVRLSQKDAIAVQRDLSNDDNLKAINKSMDTWRSLSAYEKQVEDTGANSLLSPIARGKAASTYQTAILNAKEYFNLGVLNGPDQDILMEVVPGVNFLTPFHPFAATNAKNGIANLKQQFSDKLDNDLLSVSSRFSNYDESQVPGLKDVKRKYIQTKAEIDPKVAQLVQENTDLSDDDIIQIINTRLSN